MAARPPAGLLSDYLPDDGFQWITMHRQPLTTFDNCANILFAMRQTGMPLNQFVVGQFVAELFVRARESVKNCKNMPPVHFWRGVGAQLSWCCFLSANDVCQFANRVMAARVTFRHRHRKYEEESQEEGDIPQQYRVRDQNISNVAVDDFIHSVIQYYGLQSKVREIYCPDTLTEPTVLWAPVESHLRIKKILRNREQS
ncbi:hypothetical protein F5B19DRAFT_82861 [Rostrohypoxylon terebratum]|nr:hypothetical protein F5B19DRAFT_82861 [Rostrohypoxylon terebratum]